MQGGIDVYASPQQFGSQIGQAVSQAGAAISQIGEEFARKKREQDALLRAQEGATLVSDGQLAFSKMQLDARVTAPADGSGVYESVLQQQRDYIDAQAAKIKDPILRAKYVADMTERIVPYAQQNMEFELTQKAEYTTNGVKSSLSALENTIRGDVNAYQNIWTEGNALIESNTTIPPAARAAMKQEWAQRSAYAHFNSMLDNANSPDAFDSIEAQLKKDVWKSRLTPTATDKLFGEIAGARKTYMTQASTAASAALASAEERLKSLTTIPPNELAELDEAASKSQNPTLIRRAAEVQRRNYLIENNKSKPATELEAMATGVKQGGYGLPDRVNTAIQQATTLFPGVSASYLGGTAILEYGQHLNQRTRVADPKFAPQVAGRHINTAGLLPGTANAAALAGQILGKPLILTSGYRSQAYQNALRYAKGKNPMRATIAKESQHTHGSAIDISTAGMSAQEKARTFDALVQAGFTAFGDYGEYIHADMRSNAPGSFDAKTGWLGWTKTSPEVIAALTARGYKAGAKGSELLRGNAGRDDSAIDYGRGTSNGSTTAAGLFQQTDGNFLSIVKDPDIAQRIGLPRGLSDAQLLELRKDPNWSTFVAAAYAEQNQKALTPVLGRPANDAELYMAHFLGAGGATTLFSAYQNNPDANAAQLMPEAAKNNPGRFFANGRPMTVKEVYDNMVVAFTRAPNRLQYEDAQTLSDMAKGKRERERNNTMQEYSQTVLQGPPNDLNQPDGFAKRAAYVSASADLFNLPIQDVKPFMPEEKDQLEKIFSGTDSDAKLVKLTQIVEMDKVAPGSGQAALNQLGLKDTATAYAAERLMDTGDSDVATNIMRGQEKLMGRDGKLDTGYAKGMFSLDGQADQTERIFNETVGKNFKHLGGEAFKAALGATRAYYANRYGSGQSFDEEDFKTSAMMVTGGGNKFDLNGEEVIVPPGIDPVDMDRVFENLQDDDLVLLSESGKRPIDVHGNPVSAEDVKDYGKLEWTGGNTYLVRMGDDGTYLVTGDRGRNGRLLPYRIEADKKVIETLAARPTQDELEYNAAPQANPEVQQPDLFNLPGTQNTAPQQTFGTPPL